MHLSVSLHIYNIWGRHRVSAQRGRVTFPQVTPASSWVLRQLDLVIYLTGGEQWPKEPVLWLNFNKRVLILIAAGHLGASESPSKFFKNWEKFPSECSSERNDPKLLVACFVGLRTVQKSLWGSLKTSPVLSEWAGSSSESALCGF